MSEHCPVELFRDSSILIVSAVYGVLRLAYVLGFSDRFLILLVLRIRFGIEL